VFPLPAYLFTEIAALLASVIFWRNLKTSVLRWLPYFLFFIVAIEFTGRYIYKELHSSNAWLYNLSIPIEYLFYAFIFLKFYQKKNNKLIAKTFLTLFPLWVLFSIIFAKGLFEFNISFLKIGSIFTSLFSLLYFYEVLSNDELINPFKLRMFWITCGLFLFNAGEFAYNTFADTLMKEWKYGKKLFAEINNNLIFVLYSAIIIAIVIPPWAHREKT
jgi:hypothetical protein